MIRRKKNAEFAAALFYFFLIAVGLSFYLILCFQSNSFSIDSHDFNPSIFITIGLSSLLAVLLVFMWRSIASFEKRIFSQERSFFLRQDLLSFMPFSLSLFSPLVLSRYLTADDMRIRLKILGILMVLGFLVIKSIQASGFKKTKEGAERIGKGFMALSLRKKIFILFGVSFMIYNLCSFVMLQRGRDFTGDEPYYLLSTYSLYEDQDINVANNYARKDYLRFYSEEKHPHLELGIYARPGKKGYEYIYPINLPGISVLMLPHYWLSHFFKGEVRTFILSTSLSIWAVLLGIQLFLFFQEVWRREKVSLFFWALYSFTAPILFYSIHLYPEIVVTFFSLFVFRKIYSKKPLSVFQIVLCGFFLSSFFWMGLKYNMIFWPLLGVSLYFLFKQHKIRWKMVYFLFFPALSMGLFNHFVHSLYGTVNPISVYEGVMSPEKIKAFKELVLRIPVWLRIDSFFDYFLDQRDGLLLYAPFYFFMFAGMVEMFRRSKRNFVAVLFISIPFLFNYAFLTHRQGFCPQGRILTPLSWVMIWLVGYFFVYNRKKVYSYLFYMSCFVSVVFAVILLTHPSFLYQSTTHVHTFRAGALFLYLSNLNFYIPGWLPSFIKINNLNYTPNYIWVGLIVIFILGYAYKKNLFVKKKSNLVPVVTFLGFLFLFYWLVLFPRVVLIHPERVVYPAGEKLTFYSLNRAVSIKKAGEFRLTRDKRSYQFFFTSWRKINKLRIEFESPQGEYKVDARYFDRLLIEDWISDEKKSVDIANLPYYAYKNTHLYLIEVEISRVSPGSSEETFLLSIKPRYQPE
ncbi:MAG: hypothetical protein ACOC5S_00780 [Acidobacteriota bacterium]